MSEKKTHWLGLVAHICNPDIWVAGAGGCQFPGQYKLHSETLSDTKQLEEGNKRLHKAVIISV